MYLLAILVLLIVPYLQPAVNTIPHGKTLRGLTDGIHMEVLVAHWYM